MAHKALLNSANMTQASKILRRRISFSDLKNNNIITLHPKKDKPDKYTQKKYVKNSPI